MKYKIMKYKILIVDDEINTLRVLSAALKKEKFDVETAITAEEALSMIKNKPYDLVISDYKMPGMSGEKLLEKLKVGSPEVPVILLTAYGTIELAVNAMKKGAYTYLTKPVNLNILLSVVSDALWSYEDEAKDAISGNHQFMNMIIGKSKPMQEVFSLIRRVSKTDANILVLGESGTGKELVARAIHYTSPRADQAFISIDCTTIPSELMESELFGHQKGAFSCAYENKPGLIELANMGTVFFDEIGDLDFALEKKLLRFLQEKEIHRLGGKEKIKVDVRVLATTNRNLEEAVEKGEFRADLYYRLNVITIHLPPLRDRKEDIPLIASHYLEKFSKKNKSKIRGFDEEVMDILIGYDWPGNVRELVNVMERAVVLCPYETLNVESLPYKLKALSGEKYGEIDELDLSEMEKRIILKALDKTSWNQSKAAVMLGITRKQLRTKMKNLGLLPNQV